MRRTPSILLVLMVWAVTGGSALPAAARDTEKPAPDPRGRAAARSADDRSLEERLTDLEALVASLRAEIMALRAASSGGDASGSTAGIAELQRRIDALAREIERLRIGEAAAQAPDTTARVAGFGPAAAKVYSVRHGVSIGGYGELLYENVEARRDDGSPAGEPDTLDLERAVFYFGYKWTDHLLFNSEIEYEHAVAGEGKPGETAVEFAYLDYRPSRRFGMRGGLLLVPMGFLTELHEPPIFHGATRPEVERLILPSTWRENGAGVYGELGPVSYRAYVVASLDASGFTAQEGIREGRQEGASSLADDLAVTARVDWTPSPGLLLGSSVFAGGTGQGKPELGRARLTLWDAHAEWNARGLHLRGVCARGALGDAESVSLANDPLLAGDPSRGTAVGSRTRGWYAEAAYNVLSLGRHPDRDLSPFVRFEALDTQAEVPRGYARDPGNDRTVRTYGVTWRPIPNVAIKIDAQDLRNRAGTGADRIHFALGYLF